MRGLAVCGGRGGARITKGRARGGGRESPESVVVVGLAGGKLGVETVLVLGFSNIFADAFSMGMGEYLSSKAHNEYVMRERAREAWYVAHHLQPVHDVIIVAFVCVMHVRGARGAGGGSCACGRMTSGVGCLVCVLGE